MTDVVVVGAGIVGAACALRCAEAGLDVVVLDAADTPAAGSTGRSAAGVRVQFAEPVNVALSLASIREYAGMGEVSGYRDVGYLLLVGEDAWEDHLAGVDTQRRVGAPVEVWDLDRAAERAGGIVRAGLAGATFGPLDGTVDPHGITTTYLDEARRLGVRLRLRTEVVGVEPGGGGWQVATAGGGGGDVLGTRVVVNAAGAWSGQVAALAGLDVPVVPVRRLIHLTAPRPGRTPSPLTVDLTSGVYWRTEGERVLFGRSDHAQPPGFDAPAAPDWLERVLQAAVSRFPWFADEAIDERAGWSGFYEVTPDGNAVVGVHPGTDGWIDACGFSGHGVQHAAAVGRVVAALAADEAPAIDVSPLSVTRFAAGAAGERLVI
ncbi:MAG: NAD(P)/FAD-dependent oxidoreductase [Actinomycetes bacterium]